LAKVLARGQITIPREIRAYLAVRAVREARPVYTRNAAALRPCGATVPDPFPF
jgi:hypothetical protein